jgi:hypothetical protein
MRCMHVRSTWLLIKRCMDRLVNFDVRTRAASSTPCMNVGDGWIDVLVFKFENERRDGWVHGDLGGTYVVASSSN